MAKPFRRSAQVAALAGAIVLAGAVAPALAQTKTETSKQVTRGTKSGQKGYWITIVDRIYKWEATREVVAIYRRITARWLNNLRSRRIEGGGRYANLVRQAAAKVGWNTLLDYVKRNVGRSGNDSNGILLIDTETFDIVGLIPVSNASEAYSYLARNTGKEKSVRLKSGRSEDIKISGYVYHGSPIILDLAGLGKPDLLAASDWALEPGRKLASNALRAFDLDGSGGATWEWVGPKSGILVWDPDGTGKIASGKQLFGNYTWGERFKDGYAALARLDENGDGRLDGAELEKLAIWVDANANAVSEPGEVKRLSEHGIESLAVKAERDEHGNAHAPNGFLRLGERGERQVNATWDWIALGKAKPTEGTYVWVGESQGQEVGGYLRLQDDAGQIGGISFPTVGNEPSRYIVALPVAGAVAAAGKVTWRTPVPDGVATSEVEWEDGGKHLFGHTTVRSKSRNFDYEWEAELIAGAPIGSGLRNSAAR